MDELHFIHGLSASLLFVVVHIAIAPFYTSSDTAPTGSSASATSSGTPPTSSNAFPTSSNVPSMDSTTAGPGEGKYYEP